MDTDISLEVQRLNYLDELDTLRALATEIGVDNTFSERLIKSIESLDDLRFVFAFAEYS